VTDTGAVLILTSHELEERLKETVIEPRGNRTRLLLTHYGRWVAWVAPFTHAEAGQLCVLDTGLFVLLNEPGYGLYVSLSEFCERRLEIIDELRDYQGGRIAVLTLGGDPVLQVTPISPEQEREMITAAARALRAERTGK
jgi:hypothetical protein